MNPRTIRLLERLDIRLWQLLCEVRFVCGAHALICFLALVLYRVMRMRLKANGSAHSPKTTLEILRRLQQHRVQLGDQHLTGIGKTSPQQLELFEALNIKTPA